MLTHTCIDSLLACMRPHATTGQPCKHQEQQGLSATHALQIHVPHMHDVCMHDVRIMCARAHPHVSTCPHDDEFLTNSHPAMLRDVHGRWMLGYAGLGRVAVGFVGARHAGKFKVSLCRHEVSVGGIYCSESVTVGGESSRPRHDDAHPNP